VSEIVEGLDGDQRDRIAALRQAGRFFWVDVSLSTTSPSDLSDSLGIPKHIVDGLLSFGDAHPSARKFLADGQRVAFGIACYLESDQPRDGAPYRLRAVEVGVLVSGDYLLTVHRERLSLPALLEPYMPEGRSEQYAVYAALDAIVASAFDALNEVEETLDDLALMSADLRAGRIRMATLRATSSRLSDMRRQAAPLRGLFERIGVEITRIEGLEADDEHYFERIGNQIHRLVDAIDAAADAMARLIDLRLNVVLADRGGDHLPAAHIHHRLLWHELRLDGRTGRHGNGLLAARGRQPRGRRRADLAADRARFSRPRRA
jgi:Mg2+ and Co2+ transporter CorA